MVESPLLRNSEIVTFTIKSNGKQIGDHFSVSSIAIHLEKNIPDEAILTLPYTNQKGEFKFEDSREFSLDKEIEISLGYGFKNSKLFTGRVTQKKIINKNGACLCLQITCKHVNNKKESVPKNLKQETLLELTYGYDIMEVELFTNSIERNIINGYLKFQGSARARVGDSIDLRGFEKVFLNKNKNVISISQVSHKVENGDWITTVTVGNIN